MNPGFQKVYSGDVPRMHFVMLTQFVPDNSQYISAEIRNAKSSRATNERYADNAVGYVQFKKYVDIYTFCAKITPEHKVHDKPFVVEAVINFKEEKVVSCECKGCAADAGGCKHAIAFLFWLHRRGEEPSPTSVECYWKISALATLGNHKFDLASVFKISPAVMSQQFDFNIFMDVQAESNATSFKMTNECYSFVSMLDCTIYYKQQNNNYMAQEFLNFIQNKLMDDDIVKAESSSRAQSESPEWFEYRFGRITASKLYEAERCKTSEGTLQKF